MIKMKYQDIDFNLQRNKRKTVSIYVEPNGDVNVLAPEKISEDDLNQIIEKKRYWIYKSLSEMDQLNETKVQREIKNGEGFLYLGKIYKLKILKNLKNPFTLRQGRFYLDKDSSDDAQEHFKEFYKSKGKIHISTRIKYFKNKLGVNPPLLRIMELGNRWGSCSDKYINFHWKIMMAPMKIIDYVIVHELAHLIEVNHTDKFWELVESVIPDYKERKEWLRANGAYLDI
ncbi:MAG: SprT family zinc-dependent metalloprotease [Methanobacteriaceae archaeon]|nr:SprT family zinc-dependent metalloprotease [Methanobacteriaceae archaeon]